MTDNEFKWKITGTFFNGWPSKIQPRDNGVISFEDMAK